MTRTPRKATSQHLENAALFYLERFASSKENLRRMLMRRVERSAYAHGTDRKEGEATVDALVARLSAGGLLDDRVYAEAQVAALHRRGLPAMAIRARLIGKGVPADDVQAALEALADQVEDGDFRAAVNFARRRRLGPFRPKDAPANAGQKDLAALARAGFSYGIAQRIVQAATPEELEKSDS